MEVVLFLRFVYFVRIGMVDDCNNHRISRRCEKISKEGGFGVDGCTFKVRC